MMAGLSTPPLEPGRFQPSIELRFSRLLIPAATFLLLACPLPAMAQEGEPEGAAGEGEQPTFFEALEVYLVNVDVVVTDRRGQPVRGLSVEDFEVLEDGRTVPIVHFSAVDRDPQEAPPDTRPEAAEDPLAPSNMTLAIFVDELHLPAIQRRQRLHGLRDQLPAWLAAGDQVLFLPFDGELGVSRLPSREDDEIRRTLEELAMRASPGLPNNGERRRLEARLQQLAEEIESAREGLLQSMAAEILAGIQSYTRVRAQSSRSLTSGLRQAVSLISSLPGRRVLLYVGDPLPVSPGADLYAAWKALVDRFGARFPATSALDTTSPEVGGDLSEVAALANAHRVTIYALPTDPSEDPTSAARHSLPILSTLPSSRQAMLEGSLGLLAEPTGGTSSLLDITPLLDRLREDLRSYYSLAYRPARRRDQELHDIRVRLQGNHSYELRYRRQLRAGSRRDEMQDRTRSALLLGQPDNPLDLDLDFGQRQATAGGTERIPLTVRIPMARLALRPKESYHEGRLTLFVGARDAAGRLSPILSREVPVRIPNDRLLETLGRMGTFTMPLELRPGKQTIVVGARDELGNVEAFVRGAYPPPAPGLEP